MSVIVPVGIPAAAGWQLVDWLSNPWKTLPAAGGLAEVDCGQLDPDEMWLIDHAVVQSTSTTPTAVRLYESYAVREQLLDGSNSGNFDVSDWPAGLVLRPSTSLVVQWSGVSAGATCQVRLQARVMRRVG